MVRNTTQYWHLPFKKIKILRGWPTITTFTANFMKTYGEVERGNTQT
jgi:hypothetical protein